MDINLYVSAMEYGIIKLDPLCDIPGWALASDFVSITKTADELSIVADIACVPRGVDMDAGWRMLKIDSVLDFSLVGIIAGISSYLAEASISIFVISTYNTDYILIKKENLDKAVHILKANRYGIKIEGDAL
jgi:hypothetical protein